MHFQNTVLIDQHEVINRYAFQYSVQTITRVKRDTTDKANKA